MTTVLPHPRFQMSVFPSPLCSTAPCCLHRKWTELFSLKFQQHSIYCVNSGKLGFLFLELPLEEIKSFFFLEAFISPEGGGPTLCYHCGHNFARGIFCCQSSNWVPNQATMTSSVWRSFHMLPLLLTFEQCWKIFFKEKDLRNYRY